jgi:hypothetical protein
MAAAIAVRLEQLPISVTIPAGHRQTEHRRRILVAPAEVERTSLKGTKRTPHVVEGIAADEYKKTNC